MNINRRSAIKTIGALGITGSLVSAKAFVQTKKADAYALAGGSTPLEVVKTALDENIVKGVNVTIYYESDARLLSQNHSRLYELFGVENDPLYLIALNFELIQEMVRFLFLDLRYVF